MSSNIVIEVDVRGETGTGSARAVRREGRVPGILYGGGLDPVAISAKGNELLKAIRSGKFIAHTVTLEHKGEKQLVIPKDVQWHPVTDFPVHFDLYRVDENSIINVEVPVHFLNQETCPGLKKGGVLNVVRHTVELDVPAGKIPESIEVDLTGMEMGHVIHISAIKLPEGAKPTIDRDFTVATIASRGGAQAAADDAEDTATEE
ncbi:50S ribosomal protein L25/general stress protein Ctc [Pseudaquidulcibacter saccharophilus]|uniref:50S ribosomal protein L25/general stress protein Ctc n=1 Tax=Pseudaquidulcibacter saccharophilus TaxID=2831900 RepID=UPI001EFF1610|nr:50S ribosomal protein L25/general stress protein Ctc [Pseudaquidulcibacter saccharophilus]